MSEYRVAIKIAGELESSFNAAIAGAQRGLAALGGTGSIMSRTVGGIGRAIGTSMKIAGAALTATGAAVGAVAVASYKAGSAFETAMSSAAATANATTEQYAAMENAALEQARVTSKTAAESANALEYMALAGWSVQDSIAGLPSMIKMSEASGMELARTSDLVTDSMAAAGVTIDQMANYLDVAARAQTTSNQTAEQLMEAYIGVGGVMHNLGVPIAESATALGMLANRGIKGSEAGTALNAIMANLTTGTGQAGKMMEKLGVSAFDSEGNFIGLEATLQSLNTALEGCTEEERNAALAAIGGKHHVDALNALLAGLNNTVEDGKSEWQALQESLEDCDGALEQLRDMKFDNLEGDLTKLKSAADIIGVKLYKSALPAMREMTQGATEMLYRLHDAFSEGGIGGMMRELGNAVGDGLEAMTASLPESQAIIGEFMDGLFDGINANADRIGEAFSRLASSGIQGFTRWYGDFYDAALNIGEYFLKGFAQEIPKISDTFGDTISQLQTSIDTHLPSILNSGAAILNGLMSGLKDNMPGIMDLGATIVTDIGNAVKDNAPNIASNAVDLIGSIATGFIDHAGDFADAGLNILDGLAGAIEKNLPKIADSAPGIVDKLGEGIEKAFSGDSGSFASRAQSILNKIGTSLVNNGPQLVASGIRLMGKLASGMLQGAGLLISQIPGIFRGVVSVIKAIDWKQVGSDLMQDIIAGVESFGGALIAAAKGIFDQVGELMGVNPEVRDSYESRMLDDPNYNLISNGANAGKYQNSTTGEISTAFELAQQGVAGAGRVASQMAKETAQAYAQTFADTAAKNGPKIGKAVESATNGDTWNMDSIMGGAENTSKLITDTLTKGAEDGGAALSAAGTEVGTEAMTATSEAVESNSSILGNAIEGAFEALATEVESSGQEVSSAASDAAAGMGEGMSEVPTMTAEAAQAATETIQQISESLTQITEAISTAFTDVVTQITDTTTNISEAFTTLGDQITTAVDTITTAFTDIGTQASTLGTDITTAMTDMGTGITTAVTGVSLSLATLGMAFATATMGISLTASMLGMTVTMAFTAMQTAITTGITNIQTSVTTAMTTMQMSVSMGMMAISMSVTMSLMMLQMSISMALMTIQMSITMAMMTAQMAITAGMAAMVAVVTAGMAAFVAVITSGCAQALAIAQSTASGIVSTFSSMDLYSAGVNAMQGLINGMEAMRAQVIATAQSIAAAAAAAVSSALAIGSPSRVLMEMGEFAGEGFAIGMEDSTGRVTEAAQGMAQPAITETDNARDGFRSGVLRDTLSGLAGGGASNTVNNQTTSPTFNFNPTYVIEGNADQNVIQEANRMSQSEFERMANEWVRQHGRVAFA